MIHQTTWCFETPPQWTKELKDYLNQKMKCKNQMITPTKRRKFNKKAKVKVVRHWKSENKKKKRLCLKIEERQEFSLKDI